LEKLQQHISY